MQETRTVADVRRVIAEAIEQESNRSLDAAAASRCAASVLARLKEAGVRLVKKRAE